MSKLLVCMLSAPVSLAAHQKEFIDTGLAVSSPVRGTELDQQCWKYCTEVDQAYCP